MSLDYEKRASVKTPEWIELAGWVASRPNLEFEGGARNQPTIHATLPHYWP
jgi:hypothetical protein